MSRQANAAVAKAEQSVVQVIAEHVYPNYTRPWIRSERGRGTGSGFCVMINVHDPTSGKTVPKKYIITNMHCVQNPVRIQLHRADSSHNVPARIAYAAEECDLAILETDEKFLKNIPALPIAEMPKKLDTVYVIGYPLGGINVSLATGVVNRIQIIPYLGVTRGIAIQVDAPINFGNSGGPAVNAKGHVVGVAFSGEDDARTQNMGYIIPTLILSYVMNKFGAGILHQGLGNLGFLTQGIPNPAMRERYGLAEGDPGILVTASQSDAVMIGDILTHVDKSPIDSDGRIFLKDIVRIETGEVVPWHAGYSLVMPGEDVSLGLIRGGKAMRVKLPVGRFHRTIPYMYTYEQAEGYVIVGGLVFVTLSWPLIEEKRQNREGDTYHLISIGFESWMKRGADNHYVVLSDILDSPLMEGYEPHNQIVRSVNGKKFRSLVEFHGLVESIRATGTGYLEFEVIDSSLANIVVSVKQLAEHQDQILADNGISKGHHLPVGEAVVKPKSGKKST